MNIIISTSNGQPIYEQILRQIKHQILTGELPAGGALPSMRTLASELKVSVITTKRAYEELEKEGFIESYTGKGSFVKAQNSESIKEQHLMKIKELLKEIIALSKPCGIKNEEIMRILENIEKGE